MNTIEDRIEGWKQRMSERTTYYMRCDACNGKMTDEDDTMLATALIIGGWTEDEDGNYLCGGCKQAQENGEVLQIVRAGRIKYGELNDV